MTQFNEIQQNHPPIAPVKPVAPVKDVTRPLPALAARMLGQQASAVTGLMAQSRPAPVTRTGWLQGLTGALMAGVTALGLLVAVAPMAEAAVTVPAEITPMRANIAQPEQVRRRPDLPRACVTEISNRGGSYIGLRESCLRREGFRAELPRRCGEVLRLRHGRNDRAYSLRCLERAGFDLSQPRRNHRHDARPFGPRPPQGHGPRW